MKDEDQLLQSAIDAIKNHDREVAHNVLTEILKNNPNNDKAWTYFAYVSKSRQQAIECLKKALSINPKNNNALELIGKLEGKNITQNNMIKGKTVEEQIKSKNKNTYILLICICLVLICIVLYYPYFKKSNINKQKVTTGSTFGVDYSPSTYFYVVEYQKPISGAEEVYTLDLTFICTLDAQTAERLLREELTRAITIFPPKGDVLAHLWTQTDSTPGSEEMINLPDGSDFLIYSFEFKQIQTEKEYSVAKTKAPEKGAGLIVQISVELEKGDDGKVRIRATTNLPDKMVLMLGLRGDGFDYFAQDKVIVAQKGFVSEWFSDRGKALSRGVYKITISSPLPDLQPKEVRAVIGEAGENLEGPVSVSMGSKMVEFIEKRELR
jgi:tetratricopeptide (TPR) repeat protein